MKPQIVDAKSQDVYQNWHIQKAAWLVGYTNEEIGVTKEDILSFFDETSENNQKKLREREWYIDNDPSIHVWEAIIDGKIVGFAVAKRGKTCLIDGLFVTPEFQERGIGGMLTEKVLAWLGPEDIYVFANAYNKNAIDFYKHFGFIETGKKLDSGMDFLSGRRIYNIEMVRKSR